MQPSYNAPALAALRPILPVLAGLMLGLALLGSLAVQTAAGSDRNLPELSQAGGTMVSPRQERELGQQWLRLYRSQVPTSSDPLLVDYLEKLLAQLAQHSELSDRRLNLVVAENPTLNAFAVPGGVVGLHTGLLTFAQSEHQLAAVLAHELAHLSQRHYARRLEQQRNMTLPVLAGLLGGLILAAAGSAEGGSAAIMSTQAAAADRQLRFSRQHEQEADRIGIQTLAQAGMDPHAAGGMFEQMLHASRFRRSMPEFLRSHPITENRIADARNRAMQYPIRQVEDNPEFHLMRSRVLVTQAETAQQAVARFTSELNSGSLWPDANRYGLALAQTRAGDHEQARKTLAPLLKKEPERITYQILAARIDTEAGAHEDALARLSQWQSSHPSNHPLNVSYGEALMKAGDYLKSAEVLSRYARERDDDPYVWYLLAEVRGLAGDILGVHEARAEYFILNGLYDQALVQLRLALRLAEDNFHRRALLEERMRYAERQQQALRER